MKKQMAWQIVELEEKIMTVVVVISASQDKDE
jgi:hypothetical protein